MANGKATSSSTSYGIGFVGFLTIVLIVLKATGHIDWPWLWSPLLLSFLCFVGFLVFLLLVAVLAVLWEASKKK